MSNGRSLRSYSLHHADEFSEQIVAVMRSGGRFGVVLDSKSRVFAMSNAFDGIVVQVDVSHLNIGW